MEYTCPKCHAVMERGAVIDSRGEPCIQAAAEWRRSDRNTHITIVSYRCTQCGYLESYALPEDVEIRWIAQLAGERTVRADATSRQQLSAVIAEFLSNPSEHVRSYAADELQDHSPSFIVPCFLDALAKEPTVRLREKFLSILLRTVRSPDCDRELGRTVLSSIRRLWRDRAAHEDAELFRRAIGQLDPLGQLKEYSDRVVQLIDQSLRDGNVSREFIRALDLPEALSTTPKWRNVRAELLVFATFCATIESRNWGREDHITKDNYAALSSALTTFCSGVRMAQGVSPEQRMDEYRQSHRFGNGDHWKHFCTCLRGYLDHADGWHFSNIGGDRFTKILEGLLTGAAADSGYRQRV